MVTHNRSSVNPHHVVQIAIPFQGEDDHRWVEFAGQKLADRFGRAIAGRGVAGWEDSDGLIELRPVLVLRSDVRHDLTDLDLTILFGITLAVYEGLGRRAGVTLTLDDDAFTL